MTGFGNKNRAELIGRLGKNPEVTIHPSGAVMAKFQVATERRFKRKSSEEWESNTTWHQVMAWGRLAEFARKYFRKGKRVSVEGRMENFSYEKGGETRYGWQIVAEDLQLLDKPEKNESGQPAAEPSLADLPPAEAYDDDVPF